MGVCAIVVEQEKLELFLEGKGASTKIRHKYNHTDCTESTSTTIAHTPITNTDASSPMDIIADIRYAGTNPNVLVVYRKDDGSWNTALMALDSGTNENGTWKGQIQAYDEA